MHESRRQLRDSLNHPLIIPEPLLGQENAEKEWADQEDSSVRAFIHTPTYSSFRSPSALFLFGRRGTGKTAMMRMLEHEVRQKSVPHYQYCGLLDHENVYYDFSSHIRTGPMAKLPFAELVHFLKKKWSWVLQVSAMQAVVAAERKTVNTDHLLSAIDEYLKEEALSPLAADPNEAFPSPLRRLVAISAEAIRSINHAAAQSCLALYDIFERLTQPSFEAALKSLRNYLRKTSRTCLLLVDSLEYYTVDDDIARAVRTALIETTREIFDESPSHHTLAKVAFPSEVYPHLSAENEEKIGSHNLFILWQFHDLVCLLALRYRRLVALQLGQHESDLTLDYQSARGLLYTYMPKTIETRSGIQFDTLAYFIEHTQKKPRQVIELFNVVLTLARHSNGKEFFRLTDKVIRDGIHSRLDLLVRGSMNMYDQIYPQAESFIRRVLTDAQYRFDYAYLDQRLKEVSAMRARLDLTLDQVRRLLLECGALGKVVAEHKVYAQEKFILEAVFEYQVKGILTLTNESVCVVHPMFYQELRTVMDPDRFTYPTPAEDSEASAVSDLGINLWDFD